MQRKSCFIVSMVLLCWGFFIFFWRLDIGFELYIIGFITIIIIIDVRSKFDFLEMLSVNGNDTTL